MIITARMLRDKLAHNGPMSLSELVKALNADDIGRSEILILLNQLQDAKEIRLNNGLWRALISLH